MSLQIQKSKGMKRFTTERGYTRIKKLCISDRRKVSGCIQCKRLQANRMFSARTIRRKKLRFGLNSRISLKSHFYLSIKG